MEIRDVKTAERFSNDKMQKVNLVETANLFADIYCLEPGQEQKVHAHTGADKIYFVVQGSGRFHIGGDEQEVGSNHLVLAPADVPHGVRNASTERLVVLVMMAPNPNVKR